MLGTYNRYSIVFDAGEGRVSLRPGEPALSRLSSGLGVNALGHAHPRIVKTIREQVAKLIHVSNLYYHEYQDYEYQGALAASDMKAGQLLSKLL